MAYENGLTHFDKSGQAIMVDVSEKKETSRTAIASGRIRVNRAVYAAIEQGTAKKGDVLGTARIAAAVSVPVGVVRFDAHPGLGGVSGDTLF